MCDLLFSAIKELTSFSKGEKRNNWCQKRDCSKIKWSCSKMNDFKCKDQDKVCTSVSPMYAALVEKLEKQAKDFDKKLHELKVEFDSVRRQVGSVRFVPDAISKIKTPSFDGTTSFNVFKIQFETLAKRNGWNNREKAFQLVLALKGSAAEVLEILPSSSTDNFDEIMNALHRKYGSDHKTEIFRMELRRRMQNAGETLQDFAFEIERLVQQSYPDENHPYLYKKKIDGFVYSIRDPDIKCAVLAEKKSSFRETVSFALVQETARIVCEPQVCELRSLETDVEDETIKITRKDLKAIIGDALAQLVSLIKNSMSCCKCQKFGHSKRNRKASKRKGSVLTVMMDPSMNQKMSKKCVSGVRTMRLGFGEDWSSSQRNDLMLAKKLRL